MTIPAGEIAAMASTVADHLPDTCEIQRLNRTKDGQGGYTEAFSTVATVACKRAPAATGSGESETTAGDAIRSEIKWVFTLPTGTEVRASDQIEHDNRLFEVQVSTWDRGATDLATRAYCSEAGK